jgi:hypothetical protein
MMSDATFSRLFSRDGITKLASEVDPAFDGPRRTTHGSHAWSLPSQRVLQLQPQDGAISQPTENEVSIGTSRLSPVDTSMLREPEDAHLSGAMRSLARRVIGLNVTASRKVYPAFKQAELVLPKLLKRLPGKSGEVSRSNETSLTNRPQVA